MNSNLRLVVTISIIIIFIGIFMISMNFIKDKRDLIYNNINLSLSNDTTLEDISVSGEIEEVEQKVETPTNKDNENKEYEYYIGKIEIPKINLSRGFYDKNSLLNDVRWNIKVLKESSYPNKDNGNLILAAHSGNYSNSYFSNLYKLEINDIAYIYYQNIKYTYKMTNIYNEVKDGDVEIRRNPNKTILTLITCTKDDDNHQTIYILELIGYSSVKGLEKK